VQKSIDGSAGSLKERTIGIDVFHREPSFDTSADCIVRVVASEVRKRLAQYYQEPGHNLELYIDLPPGSYIPRIREPQRPMPAIVTKPETAAPVQRVENRNLSWPGAFSISWLKLAIAAALMLAAVATFAVIRNKSDAGLNRFWGPILEPSSSVIICVGTVEPEHISPDFRKQFTVEMANTVNGEVESAATGADFRVWPAVSWIDAVELTRIAEMLTRHDKKFLLRSSEETTLADLRKGPVILMGVLENSWTLRLVSKLRFHPRMDYASQKMWIEDSQHPERKDWSCPWGNPFSDSYDDYALVTRSINPLSGQVSIVLGGLGLHASQAAAEFATNPVNLKSLSSSLGDPNKSVQIVLKITVVKGEAGPPQVVAAYYW
jgi:hypothetical protein